MSKHEYNYRLDCDKHEYNDERDCKKDFGSLVSCGRDALSCLKDNIGSVVTIFTASGGASGCGFTGLLVRADSYFVKLVTSFPSAPTHPFRGCCGCGNNINWNRHFCRGDILGSIACIPTDQIVAFVVNAV